MLEINQQIISQIEKARQILLVFKKNWETDSVASALALFLWLKKTDKLVDVMADGFIAPAELKFLPALEEIKPELHNLQKFVINLKLNQNQVSDFAYDTDGDNLKIFLTPKTGEFKESDVTAGQSNFLYDLIITVDTPDLNSLGAIYEKNLDFFFNTPLINFDHATGNEHFGQINLIDVRANSTAEIIYQFLHDNFSANFDENIATCLLAGIMGATTGFKTGNISPQTLGITSELLALGSNREQIVQNLFHAKSLSALKLWGRLLARLQPDRANHLVWSLLSYDDFIKSGATPTDIKGAVKELVTSLPQAEIILILYEQPSGEVGTEALAVHGQLFTSPNYSALDLVRAFRPAGDKTFAHFIIPEAKLLEAEKIMIDEIRKKIAN
ncbi:MAG: DHH family phosphoesterase [Patescibacteria group bacterium]|nr:DHH family phosphoesterase [Patescibacteria group bacterium]